MEKNQMNSQMLKGILEGCILKIVCKEETYGYKITEELLSYGFNEVNESSIYAVLIRLEKKKYISSVSRKSPLGPKRKYFTITDEGKMYLLHFEENWNGLKAKIDNVLEV